MDDLSEVFFYPEFVILVNKRQAYRFRRLEKNPRNRWWFRGFVVSLQT